MFFDHTGSSSSCPTSSETSTRQSADAALRRKRLLALGLAVAMATPVTALQPAMGGNPDLRKDFSPVTAGVSSTRIAPAGPIARTNVAAPTIATVLQAAEAASDAQLLKQGQDAIGAGDYEGAKNLLQQVNASNLTDRDRRALSEATAQADTAVTERQAARAQFDLGEAALKGGNNSDAITHYQAAIDNKFADEGTRNKSREQLELARANAGGQAPAVVAEAPAVEPAPAVDAVADAAPIEEAAAPQMSARQHYDQGVKDYKSGDWIAAREHLNAAVAGGFRGRPFMDPPARILARMDKKEQADARKSAEAAQREAAQAAQRAADEQAAAAAPVVPVVSETAVAQATELAAAPTPGTEVTATPVPETAPAVATAPAAPVETAEMLIEQANAAAGKGQFDAALALFDRALVVEPENATALEGRRSMQQVTGRGGNANLGLAGERARIEARRAAILYNFNDALGDANEAIRTNRFDEARTALERARVSRNTDTTVFSRDELSTFDSRVANSTAALEQARDAFAGAEVDRTARETAAREQDRLAQGAAQSESTIRGLINQTQTAIREGRYAAAQGTIAQILLLDPLNDYAIGVRPFVQDQAHFREQRDYREEFDQQMTKTLNRAEQAKIPFDDIIIYPENWPDLSATRDRTVAIERGVQQEDAAVQAQLDKRLPELRFDAVGFSDVVDFLRDVSGSNIFVNWRALETAGIDRTTPVTLRLRDVPFRKALTLVLSEVGGGTVQLAYTIDEGVITISTADELATNTTTQTYDIRDLIINVPDFEGPEFDLSSSSGGGGEGGGGGGGGASLFGDSGTGTSEEDEGPSREELVEQITTLIKTNISSDSWQDNGGTVGTLSELNGTLIVTQTPENQERVAALLEKLREQRAIQVTVEARFLTVQRNYLEDIGVDFDFAFNTTGRTDDNLTQVNIGNSTADFTGAPSTGVPGSIGETAVGLTANAPGGAPITFTFLDDFQVNLLVRATQAAQTTTSLTAPRLTLFNGQRAFIAVQTLRAYVSDLEPVVADSAAAFDPEVETIPTGVSLDVQATVSADRKYVTLTLRPTLSALLNIFTFTFGGQTTTTAAAGGDPGGGTTIVTGDAAGSAGAGIVQLPETQVTQIATTVSVPDGGTLLLGGQTLAGEIEKEAGVPVLSKIPFLKRLFTNRSMAKDEQVLLILVKPTIIIQREVEDRQFPLLSSRVSGG